MEETVSSELVESSKFVQTRPCCWHRRPPFATSSFFCVIECRDGGLRYIFFVHYCLTCRRRDAAYLMPPHTPPFWPYSSSSPSCFSSPIPLHIRLSTALISRSTAVPFVRLVFTAAHPPASFRPQDQHPSTPPPKPSRPKKYLAAQC
jgi:hypothetical protein